MSFESVDLYIKDNTSLENPISGVVVKVYNQAGTLLHTMGQSDASGVASFLLESGFTYQLRFYKFGVSFRQPQYIEVLTAVTNAFDVVATPFVPPVSSDPRMCLAYGYFRTFSGQPARYVDIIFISKFSPIWLEGAGVLTERQSVRTDENGYACIPLIRCGRFDVTVQGYDDMTRTIAVPDSPNVNLPDLLFPIVSQVVMTPAGPYALTVGQEIVLTPELHTSDGNTLADIGSGDVRWSSSNDQVVAVLPEPPYIRLRAIAAGTAEVQVIRLDNSIIHIPDPGILGQPIAVVVT